MAELKALSRAWSISAADVRYIDMAPPVVQPLENATMWDRAKQAIGIITAIPMMLLIPVLLLLMWASSDKDTSRAYDR
ncbi:hypothetical protein [Sphingomonas sp. Leaf25]|uniref:hypothetical protein n=1 Tax=Sphingomonas sp. Leaf25 TaxID=1735692 RepID=UPI000AABDC99|nr:hypothetical protein [Sphingomonas sp. Leaf25]